MFSKSRQFESNFEQKMWKIVFIAVVINFSLAKEIIKKDTSLFEAAQTLNKNVTTQLTPNFLHANKLENNILLERMESFALNVSIVSYLNSQIRPIASNVYKVNITMVLKVVLENVWVRFVLYHKYQRYPKFLIDVWENGCDFLSGSSTSPMIKILIENSLRAGVKLSFKLRCPFSGTIIVAHDRLNVSGISIPLFPAGRYRLDLMFATAKHQDPYVKFQTYVSISDLRVWF